MRTLLTLLITDVIPRMDGETKQTKKIEEPCRRPRFEAEAEVTLSTSGAHSHNDNRPVLYPACLPVPKQPLPISTPPFLPFSLQRRRMMEQQSV